MTTEAGERIYQNALKIVRMHKDEERAQMVLKANAAGRKLLGRTFKFRNSSGGRSWWMYAEIVGLRDAGDGFSDFVVEEIEEDDGLLYMRITKWPCAPFHGSMPETFISVPLREFNRRTAGILRRAGLKRIKVAGRNYG